MMMINVLALLTQRSRRLARRATMRARRAWRLARTAWQNPRAAHMTRVEIAYTLLDRTAFTWLLNYIKYPLHVIAVFVLWLVMLSHPSNTTLQLLGGNYFNGVGALAGCILLMRQYQHHRAQRHATKQLHQHVTNLHAKVDALATRRARVSASTSARTSTSARSTKKAEEAPRP